MLRTLGDGTVETVLPAPWNARSQVHEYGGGSWAVSDAGVLFFVEKTDQRIWMLSPGGQAVAITEASESAVRHGGLRWQHGHLLAVREDHLAGGVPRRSIIAYTDGRVDELAAGSDFLAQPALSADGSTLAWVAWDHPDMPWDRTRIRTRRLDADDIVDVTDGTRAALQPTWTDAGLVFIDEPSGRWNLFRIDGEPGAQPRALAPADEDTGGGLWVLGLRWYAALTDGSILAVRTHGSDRVVRIFPDGTETQIALPATARVQVEDDDGRRVLVSGSGPGLSGIWLIDEDDTVHLVRGSSTGVDRAWLPEARVLEVEGPHGPVHAFDYPPTSPDHAGTERERAPYVVFVHGGPTAHVGGVPDAKTVYFTSRGIGVLDVNYGGSTGYGRAYRRRLQGMWGVVDVDDVVAAAAGLTASGDADAERIAIEGGSAGGWTVLGALVGSDVFGAGISRYGVGDARLLAEDTHDFEARYLDGLIGPLPEAEHLYRERSPLSRADRFRVPLLLLQGDEDAVVPPTQAEAIRDALAARGVPHAYVRYAGEGHGFRQTENVIHALESELAFLGQVFGFDTPGVEPVALTTG